MKQWSILLVFLSLSLSLSAQQGYEKDVFVSSTGDSLP
ncbi:phospholipase, partial [Bacteroides thetaiotaomicron]